jgi:hypothetical protein
MNRFLLFLRSLIWTAVFSVASAITALVLALTNSASNLAITFAIVSVALALLSNPRN